MRSLCIVPVFNQASELALLFERCRNHLACDEVLFIDDGSNDGSFGMIRRSGFNYIRNHGRIGIGHALIQGTRYALKHGFDVVIHMAGNGKMLPAEMYRLLDPIRANQADYVWGSRFLPGGRFVNAPKFRKFGIPFIFNQIPRFLTGKRVTDATCGYRAYKLSVLENDAPDWDHPWLYRYEFEYYVLAKVLLGKSRYLEVPISMVYPASGKNYSKITPIISWWSMLRPWLIVRLGLEPKTDRALIYPITPLLDSGSTQKSIEKVPSVTEVTP